MSGNHYFALLRKHAVKVAKFKQGVLIEDLHSKSQITSEQQPIRNYGACAALCCMWLYMKLHHERSLNRSADSPVDLEFNQPFAKIGVALQTEYMRGFDPTEWVKRTKEMYNVFDLDFQVDPENYQGAGKIMGQAASLLQWRAGVLISLSLSDGRGHAVAICRINSVDYFFDPNAGEYQIIEMKPFLVEYLKAAKKFFNASITGGHRVAITKK